VFVLRDRGRPVTALKSNEQAVPAPAAVMTEERLRERVPWVTMRRRALDVTRHQLASAVRRVGDRLPAPVRVVDTPRTQPLRSASLAMYRFWKSPFGSAEKPHSLNDNPWDYVDAHRATIPFLGLREYWYPALESKDLRNNETKPVLLAGDQLVFFRDATGAARALENRCPHRGPLLSLGQVGVIEPGTITCRYHGMTFDGSGACVAFLTDGPDSPACGRVTARSYPVQELRGVIWVYMGSQSPRPVEEAVPHAATMLAQPHVVVQRFDFPFSYLNQLDNAIDLAHLSCLHRSCALFGDQKGYGSIGCEDLDGGVRAFYTTPGEHPGPLNLDHIALYLPGFVYHGRGKFVFSDGETWFWFVPKDIGSFEAWLMIGSSDGGVRWAVLRAAVRSLFGPLTRYIPGASCIFGGDGPIQLAQGRIARWDLDHLSRTDRAVVRMRRLFQNAHIDEQAQRVTKPLALRRHDEDLGGNGVAS